MFPVIDKGAMALSFPVPVSQRKLSLSMQSSGSSLTQGHRADTGFPKGGPL